MAVQTDRPAGVRRGEGPWPGWPGKPGGMAEVILEVKCGQPGKTSGVMSLDALDRSMIQRKQQWRGHLGKGPGIRVGLLQSPHLR